MSGFTLGQKDRRAGVTGMSWKIIGHDWAVDLLRRSLTAGRVAHAYLFSGPPQVGKTTLALALAKALNCTQADPPCGRCPSCLRIARGVHPDVQLVLGEGARDSIKIEQIRALQREAVLAPYEGRHRVFVLQRIDRASVEAANSLLKTLEEPPGHTVLVLTALDPEALPATIVSRCQRLDLRPAAHDIVEVALRERGVPSPTADLLSRLSGGRVGWALCACENDATLLSRQQGLDSLSGLLSEDRLGRLEYASKASREPVTVRQHIELWISWWRDVLLLCSQSETGIVNVDQINEIRQLSRQLTLAQAVAGLQALQAAADQMEANVNARLAIEGLLLQLPRSYPLPHR